MKTRKIKTLLVLLREYFPKSDVKERGALCFAAYDMYLDHYIITEAEYYLLRDYIHDHREIALSIKGSLDDDPYFFEEGRVAPRLEFLDKLIAEL